MPVIPVAKDGKTYALFICGRPELPAEGPERSRGVKFFTKPTDEFQLGVIERPKGYEVKPHAHPERHATINGTAEFLYVEKGKIQITIFDEQWKEIGQQTVSSGDFLLFLAGGHALTMLEDTRLIEVKQGPYPGDAQAKVYR